MGVKELGRQVKEGLDEIGQLRQQFEQQRKKSKVNNNSIKCPCCDEVISGGDNIVREIVSV